MATNLGDANQSTIGRPFVTKPAPSWECRAVVDGEIREVKLSEYQGKYLVLFFYPKDFTYVCPTEITAFDDRLDDFRAVNAEVVGCSVDTIATHCEFVGTAREEGGVGPLRYPLLSDATTRVSRDYGVYIEDLGQTLRGLFIIDDKGILRHVTINDLPVGRSVEETLRLVKAFQYTDTHSVVCPIDWIPGCDAIVPDPKEKMKYFKKKTMNLEKAYEEDKIPRAFEGTVSEDGDTGCEKKVKKDEVEDSKKNIDEKEGAQLGNPPAEEENTCNC